MATVNLTYEAYSAYQIGEGVHAGDHIAVIHKAFMDKSNAGNDMLVIQFDFARSDEQSNLLGRKANEHPDKRGWTAQGTHYITLGNDYTIGNLKRFAGALRESNNGYEFIKPTPNGQSDFDLDGVVGKEIGVNLRQEEFMTSKGEIGKTCKVHHFLSADDVDMLENVEPIKKLSGNNTQPTNDGFNKVDDSFNADELPFV